MNLNKGFSGNIEQAYENIFINNKNSDYRRPLQNRKSPLNNNSLRNNHYYTFNKPPESIPYIGEGYCQNIRPNFIKIDNSDNINLDENININDYLIKNQNRKKAAERSPLNYRVQHNNNYLNYNKNFINNNNIIKNRNNILNYFDSGDYDDNNINNQYSEDDINNMNNKWKKKIQKINEQNANYEYFNMYRDNFSKNNSFQNRNNFFNDKNSVNSQSDYSNHNQMLSQSVNINLNQPKKFHNKIYNNQNVNLSNDNNQKYSQDYYSELSDNNSIKNQTYQNYYKYDFNQNYYNNNDSLSSNLYDESFEKNKTQNYTKKLKKKFSDISKFFNSYKSVNTVSVSSQDMNSSSEYYKDDDTYNSVHFKCPMKNDEKHYHQNLTIKIKKKDDKNFKKNEKVNNSERPKKLPQYIDNTPEGCNVSTNTDINFRTKNISNFEIYPKENKINKYLSYNSDNSNISDQNYNNISNSTMIIPQKIQNQFKNNNLSNKNIYINKNKEPLLMNSIQIKINNNANVPYRQILNNRRQFKGRSPQNILNYNRYNDKFNNLYNNNLSSNNINNTPNKNNFSRFGLKSNHLDNFQNRIDDNIYEKQPNFQKEKKIKEITVDLSPRKNFFNLANSNGNLNNRINNITPNYDYNFNNNINNFNRNDFDDKFNFNNISIKPKSKIESCIITFDKNKNNNNKKFKLSNSLDGLKQIRTKKYIRKKIAKGTANNAQNNNNYKFNETPGMNNSKNKNNIITNKFIYNKNKSPKAIYQKPGNNQLSNSFGKTLSEEKETDNNEGVQDYCAPSPDYGKRGKNLDDNLLSNIYNHSPLLVSGNFKVIDNEKREQQNPYSPKYDEFSFKQKLNSDVNDENYITSKPIKVKIINESNSNISNNNNNIKSIYMKKAKTNNKLNNANNNSNNNNNFSLFTSQRIPTFSNLNEIIKEVNNSNINRINEDNGNISNNIINHKKKSSEVTPFGNNEILKNEKPITKLIVKSFSSKKIEPKVKSKLNFSFFRKYYKLYMKKPKIDVMYISKCILKPIKKPLTSINYVSKNKYRYIYKVPKSSCEYFTKKFVPNSLILPKIDISYISKIFIKNKQYIENRLNNIGNDKLLNNNNIKLSDNKNKNININSQSKPIKKRIILIRKTKKTNKKFSDNLKNNNIDNNYEDIHGDNDNIDVENNAAALPIINNEEIDNSPFKKLELKIISNNKDENISPLIREEITSISDKKEELNKNIENTINTISDYSSKEKVDSINRDTNIKNDKIYIKKKKILQNIMRKERRLPENKKFDNELSIDSLDNDLSFNLNINKIKNESNNDSKLFKYYNNNKSIDTSIIKSQSNNTSINEGMNKTSSSFYNMIKTNALNFSINNNLNSSNNEDLSMISNNTMNLEIDKFHNTKKNSFKIRTVIRGIKKKSKHDFLKNFKNKNIKISDLLKKHIKTKKDIDKEKKVNSIIKEDLENFVLFYKDKINDNQKMKYDWSMIEQLMIKIKVDIVDIIIGYLKACEEVVDSKKSVAVATEYIKNIIHHYKYNYLTNKNFDNIHIKILKIYLSVKNIKIYDSIKFDIYGKLLYVLINNELFFLYDLNILKQADEQTKINIKKILNNSGNNILISKFIN